jgi:hypothetical protein
MLKKFHVNLGNGGIQSNSWTRSWSATVVILNFTEYSMFVSLKRRKEVKNVETLLDTNTCYCCV